MINIKKATILDLEIVVNIRIEMLKEVNGLSSDTVFDKNFVDNVIDYFKNGNQTTLLAFDGEKVIGCATICYIYVMPSFDHQSGKRAHIMNVYTQSDYRRNGIAYQMMKMLIDEARQNKITEISLDATELGKKLYEKCGFISSNDTMIFNIE